MFGSGGEQSGNKQAFCLQSTSRYSNNEYSPLTHPYGACSFQGIQAGWGDDYGAGIECQWVDVTDLDLSGGSAEGNLSFVFNPHEFLCEGSPVLDDAGNPTFEPTEFETVHGDPVDRAVCDFVPGWDENNRGDKTVEITRGGLITSACARGQIGPCATAASPKAPVRSPRSLASLARPSRSGATCPRGRLQRSYAPASTAMSSSPARLAFTETRS